MQSLKEVARSARRRVRGARNEPRTESRESRERQLGHALDERILDDPHTIAGAHPLGETVEELKRRARELERFGPRIRRRARELRDQIEPRSVASLAVFAALTAGAAAYGAHAYPSGRFSRSRMWYRMLNKAPYDPPDWVYGPVWTALYALIAVSGWRVWEKRETAGPRTRTAALALWGVQLGLNAAWSRTFFGRRRPDLALADIGLMLGAIGGYTVLARRVDRSAAWMMAPYLAWTGFAGALNAEIVRRNR